MEVTEIMDLAMAVWEVRRGLLPLIIYNPSLELLLYGDSKEIDQ